MNPSDWEPVDVATELKHLGLGTCAKKFLDRGICGNDLYALDDAKLRQLGLLVGQRVTLLNWVKTLPAPGSKPRGSGRRPAAAGGAKAASNNVSRPQLGRKSQFDDDDDNDGYAPPPQPKRPSRIGASNQQPKSTANARAARQTYDDDYGAALPKKTTTTKTAATKTTATKTATKTTATRGGGAINRRPNRMMGGGGPPMNIPESGDDSDRVECRYCGRRFATDRIGKHESICATASKKRRAFDAKKQRLSGTEAAGYQRASRQPSKPAKEIINGKPKYKVEHENLVAALRAARKMTAYEEARQAGKKVGPPPEMPKMQEVPDDRVQCPYCGRKFGEEQFQRHVNFCSSNAPIPKVSAGRGRKPAGRAGATRGVRGKRY